MKGKRPPKKRHDWRREPAPKKGSPLRRLYERSATFRRRQHSAQQAAESRKLAAQKAAYARKAIARTERIVKERKIARKKQRRYDRKLQRANGPRWWQAYETILPVWLLLQQKVATTQPSAKIRRQYEYLRASAAELLTPDENEALDVQLYAYLSEEHESWDPYWKNYDHSRAELEQDVESIL